MSAFVAVHPLANLATSLLHGEEASKKAEKTAQDTFSGNNISENLPSITLAEKDFAKPLFVYELIVRIGFANSKSEARKLIRGQGVKLNQSLVEDEHYTLSTHDLFNKVAIISVGKKKHFKIEITQ